MFNCFKKKPHQHHDDKEFYSVLDSMREQCLMTSNLAYEFNKLAITLEQTAKEQEKSKEFRDKIMKKDS